MKQEPDEYDRLSDLRAITDELEDLEGTLRGLHRHGYELSHGSTREFADRLEKSREALYAFVAQVQTARERRKDDDPVLT